MSLVRSSPSGLRLAGLSVTLSALLAVYFASSAVDAVRIGLNRAYDEMDARAWWVLRLESVFFVLVGAVYLEKGYVGTKNFVVNKVLRNYVDVHELESYDDNYKSQLLEWCQKNGQTVTYKLLSRYKFEKRDRFKVAVLINGEKVATADDFNKKSAEQLASERAMQSLGILPEESEEDED